MEVIAKLKLGYHFFGPLCRQVASTDTDITRHQCLWSYDLTALYKSMLLYLLSLLLLLLLSFVVVVVKWQPYENACSSFDGCLGKSQAYTTPQSSVLEVVLCNVAIFGCLWCSCGRAQMPSTVRSVNIEASGRGTALVQVIFIHSFLSCITMSA